MNSIYFSCLVLFFSLAACQADPNVITDDDTQPLGPGKLLKCDSLPVPNSIFANDIGDMLVFEDSLQQYYDTLHCVGNEAEAFKTEADDVEYCQENYNAAYSSGWLAAPSVYSIHFEHHALYATSSLFARSVPQEDFIATKATGTDTPGVYKDTIIINGKVFQQTFSYDCLSGAPCVFAQAFVFSLNHGLVAIKRQDKWWTKI